MEYNGKRFFTNCLSVQGFTANISLAQHFHRSSRLRDRLIVPRLFYFRVMFVYPKSLKQTQSCQSVSVQGFTAKNKPCPTLPLLLTIEIDLQFHVFFYFRLMFIYPKSLEQKQIPKCEFPGCIPRGHKQSFFFSHETYSTTI